MIEFRQNVERYIKVHKTLHGTSFSKDYVALDLRNSFGYNIDKSLEEIDKQIDNRLIESKNIGDNKEEHF